MAKIITFHNPTPKDLKENPIKFTWEYFLGLDRFLQGTIIFFVLIIIITPFIITNYQIFNPHASTADCSIPLQSAIDSAPSGSTLDLTGCTYVLGATISKPIILKGAIINVPAQSKGLTIASNNVTIDNVRITGKQASSFDSNEYGIFALGTQSNQIKNLTIQNSEVGTFGGWGIYVDHVFNPVIKSNNIHDVGYAGIMVISGQQGQVLQNNIQRVGYNVSNLPGPDNAYGIALTRTDGDLTINPQTTDFVVDGNTITDVPTWHALDTHSGQKLTFSNNTVYRASRGIFITTDGSNNKASDITITGNLFGSPKPVTFNLVAVTTFNSNNVTIKNNVISPDWPTGVYDYQNLSTNLVTSGNVTGNSLPNSTSTPSPTSTQTNNPTSTLKPTDMPTFTPTPTLKPTSTPTPSPLPTNTPIPTKTPTPTSAPTPTPIIQAAGDGILGMYFNDKDLAGLPMYRIDSKINFDWRSGSPMAGIPRDNFSVRWTGFIKPTHSETYTFYASSDDGIRVWVNKNLIINAWTDHSQRVYTGSVYLLANQKYSIKVEYYEHWGRASAILQWSSPSTAKSVIPQSLLYTYN